MTTALRAATCAALLAATGLHAQTEDAAPTTTAKRTFIPTGSSIVLRMDGPVALAEAFGQTNFGRMITGEEVGQMVEGLLPMIQAGLEEEMPPEIGDLLGELGSRFLEFNGSMTVSVRISPDLFKEDLSFPEPDAIFRHVLIVASMTPSGGGSVEEIATGFTDLLDLLEPPPLETLDVAGGLEAVMAPDGSTGFVFPAVVDGSLIMAIGGDLENALKPLLEQREEASLAVFGDNASTSGLLAHMDLDLLGTAITRIAEMSGEMGPLEMDLMPQLGGLLGLSSMTALNMRVRPVDEFVVSEIEVLRIPSENRGLFDLMATGGRPKLANWILRDHESSSVFGFDMSGIPDMMEQVLGMVPPEMGVPPMEAIEGMIAQETGYDLRTQILGGLSGEFLMFNDTMGAMSDMFEDLDEGAGLEDNPMGALGYTFVIGLEDAAAYEKMIEDLLRKAGLHVQRSKIEYQGVNVSRFDLIGAMEFAFLDGAMLFGLGERGTSTMRRVIDRAQALKAGQASSEWPEDIAKRLQVVGEDWSALTIQRTAGIFDMFNQLSTMAEGLGGADPELDQMMGLFQMLGSVGPLFQKYGIDTSVSVQKITPNRILTQSIN